MKKVVILSLRYFINCKCNCNYNSIESDNMGELSIFVLINTKLIIKKRHLDQINCYRSNWPLSNERARSQPLNFSWKIKTSVKSINVRLFWIYH